LLSCAGGGDERPNGGPWPKIGLRQCLKHSGASSLGVTGLFNEVDESGSPSVDGPAVSDATATCRLDSDGLSVIRAQSISTAATTFAQIAAEALGTDASAVRVKPPTPTQHRHGCWAARRSRIPWLVYARGAEDAVEQIKNVPPTPEASVETLSLSKDRSGYEVSQDRRDAQEIASLSMSMSGGNQPILGRGSRYHAECPQIRRHEVEVDDLTGEVQVTRYVAVQDVGFAINPASVEGQIWCAQGIGWALYESGTRRRNQDANLMDYALPRST